MAGGKGPKAAATACFHKSPATPVHHNPRRSSSPPRSEKTLSSTSKRSTFSRSFRAYFSRSTAQVQPRASNVSELLRRVEDLQEKESILRTQLLEQKILKETIAIVPYLENEIDCCKQRVGSLEAENSAMMEETESLRSKLAGEEEEGRRKEKRVQELENEVEALRKSIEQIGGSGRPKQRRFAGKTGETEDCSCSPRLLPLIEAVNRGLMVPKLEIGGSERKKFDEEDEQKHHCLFNKGEDHKSRAPRILRPPPKPSSSFYSLSSSSTESRGDISGGTVRPPPAHPPPPPPMPAKRGKGVAPSPASARVKRVPEVVELYQSLVMRASRPDPGCVGASENAPAAAAAGTPNAKDMIGEIKNRSAHLLAIKTEVETQGEFIRALIKEVERADLRIIDDVVAFVEWLDDELSFLLDERAVLKHFDWPERKADALREAAFGYRDLKKLEVEAATFADDPRRPRAAALKKMQTLFEKLENGVYNLARVRDGSMEIYKGFKIPWQWMLDNGIAGQIKLASVKLAMKYMKRISYELENTASLVDEEELLLQGVRFAFRVHQFAGGFDNETMQAFQELRVQARLLFKHSQR